MREVFQIGDLVIMQHAGYYTEYNGVPGIIVGGLETRQGFNLRSLRYDRPAPAYKVRIIGELDLLVIAAPYQVRRPRVPAPDAAYTEPGTRSSGRHGTVLAG